MKDYSLHLKMKNLRWFGRRMVQKPGDTMIDGIIVVFTYILYFFSLFFVTFWMVTLLTEDEAEGIETGDELMITICIPAFNEEKTITRTLTSVLQLDYPHDKVEVIVVNDGSSDNTQEITEQLIKNSSDRNIVLINQENKGKGAALNVAIDKCTGTYFVCMDADSTIESNALRKMIPYYTSENVAVVLPCLNTPN